MQQMAVKAGQVAIGVVAVVLVLAWHWWRGPQPYDQLPWERHELGWGDFLWYEYVVPWSIIGVLAVIFLVVRWVWQWIK